mgnify:CR=1 FL=1
MRVAVLGFGSVWRHRLGRTESHDRFAQPVYYNTTGITVNGNVRQRRQICGYARFDVVGGFDPNHPSKMIGCVFECAEPTVWMGSNKLLFRRILPKHQHPDCFLTVARSQWMGQLAVGNEGWKSPDTWLLSLSESDGQQEALLLMSVGQWIRTSLGNFVLEPSITGYPTPRLVLHANG